MISSSLTIESISDSVKFVPRAAFRLHPAGGTADHRNGIDRRESGPNQYVFTQNYLKFR